MTANDLIELLKANPSAEIYHHDCEWGISQAVLEPVKMYMVLVHNVETGSFRDGYKTSLSQKEIDQFAENLEFQKSQNVEQRFNEIVDLHREMRQPYVCYARNVPMTLELFALDHAKDIERLELELERVNAAPWSFVIGGGPEA